MTSGFYEQLGVEPDANAGQLRAAYGRAVAKLVRRRKQIVEQGGDPAQVDVMRVSLDEAWSVVSDPVRRRRYDAMIQWTTRASERSADALWADVGDSLIHPAAALAVKLLRVTTHLQQMGQVPLAPSSSEDEPPTLVPADDDLTAPRLMPRKLAPAAETAPQPLRPRPTEARPVSPRPDPVSPRPDPSAPVVSLPRVAHATAPAALPIADAALRVVDGSTSSALVLTIDGTSAREGRPSRRRDVGPEDVAALVDGHGYTGDLLRAVREARGLTLQEVADTTRISVRYLEAIEADRFADLPSATFVRGYVREVARVLGLDAESVVAGYMRRFGG